MYQPKVPVKTAAEVKAILGKDFPSQVGKILDHIDAHCRAWQRIRICQDKNSHKPSNNSTSRKKQNAP